MPTVIGRRTVLALFLGSIALPVLSGCSGDAQTTQDLIKELKNATAAVNSAILALELYQQGRSTAAITRTELSNGLDELVKSEQKVVKIKAASAEQSSRREQTLGAIRDGTSAMIVARDEAERDEPTAPAKQQLNEAAQGLEESRSTLESAR